MGRVRGEAGNVSVVFMFSLSKHVGVSHIYNAVQKKIARVCMTRSLMVVDVRAC